MTDIADQTLGVVAEEQRDRVDLPRIGVAAHLRPHGLDDVAERDVPRPEPFRVALDDELFGRPAHGRDLCDAGNLFELGAQHLVLHPVTDRQRQSG